MRTYLVRFVERKEFTYDPELFKRSDTQLALRIQREAVTKHSPRPFPRFMEVNRNEGQYDDLWHVSFNPRVPISRELDIPAINVFDKPNWKLTRIGMVPHRVDRFWLANLSLQEADYFPLRGDYVFFVGYRYIIINVVLPPEAYWQQTQVWLGLVVECVIPPSGDARPLTNPSVAVAGEKLQTSQGL
jgi:hypothetical protein